MSAWIVSKEHVNLLAQAHFFYVKGEANPDVKAANLLSENYRSVNYWYGRLKSPYVFKYRACDIEAVDPYFLLTQIDCYRYQSCEHPTWKKSLAGRRLAALKEAVLAKHNIGPNYQDHPAWKAAPWGV